MRGNVGDVARRMYAGNDANRQRRELSRSGSFRIQRFQGEKRMLSAPPQPSQSMFAGGSPAPTSHGSLGSDLGASVVPDHQIYPLVGRQKSDIGQSDDLPPGWKHYIDLSHELEAWVAGVEWMRDRGIAHRRGVREHLRPGRAGMVLGEQPAADCG